MPDFRTELAGSCLNFGNLLRSQGRAEDALEWYSNAIPPLEANLARDPRLATERRFLRNAYRGRARALTDLQRSAEGLKDWDRAIELDQGPDRPGMRLERALTLARIGSHARAVAEAEDLTRVPNVPSGALYDLARVYGLSAAAVKTQPALEEQYAKSALALLRRAQDAGYFRDAQAVEHLRKDDDLTALRDRADFKNLRADLEPGEDKK